MLKVPLATWRERGWRWNSAQEKKRKWKKSFISGLVRGLGNIYHHNPLPSLSPPSSGQLSEETEGFVLLHLPWAFQVPVSQETLNPCLGFLRCAK